MSFHNCKIIAVRADSAEYHAAHADITRGSKEFALSSSSLRNFALCPRKWLAGWTLKDSDSLEYGRLLDTVVLTPEQFATRYAIAPATYESKGMECPTCKSVTDSKKCAKCKCDRVETVVTKDWNYQSDVCNEWREQQLAAGKEITSATEVAKAQAAAKRLNEDLEIKKFLDACERQVWIEGEWHDEATGLMIPVKCLIDLAGKDGCDRLGDLKSTKNAAPLAWAKWARFAGYDVQAAWNLDLFNAATNRGIKDFCFVLSESESPYEPGRRYDHEENAGEPEMDELCSISAGRRQYLKMIAGYCQCLKNDFWPGYDDTDEASKTGWTRFTADVYEEQRRLFAPRFIFHPLPTEECEHEEHDIIP